MAREYPGSKGVYWRPDSCHGHPARRVACGSRGHRHRRVPRGWPGDDPHAGGSGLRGRRQLPPRPACGGVDRRSDPGHGWPSEAVAHPRRRRRRPGRGEALCRDDRRVRRHRRHGPCWSRQPGHRDFRGRVRSRRAGRRWSGSTRGLAQFIVNRQAAVTFDNGGAIVNLTSSAVSSSLSGLRPLRSGQSRYETVLTQALALELRERDITVNAVSLEVDEPCRTQPCRGRRRVPAHRPWPPPYWPHAPGRRSGTWADIALTTGHIGTPGLNARSAGPQELPRGLSSGGASGLPKLTFTQT